MNESLPDDWSTLDRERRALLAIQEHRVLSPDEQHRLEQLQEMDATVREACRPPKPFPDKAQGFPKLVGNGFTHVVRTELYFAIGIESDISPRFAVYMRHGSPACGDWYRSSVPVRRVSNLIEAQALLDELAGVIDAHKHFPQFNDPRFHT